MNFLRPETTYYDKNRILTHKGDYLFIEEKISAKKTMHRENVMTLIILVGFFSILGLSVFILFGIMSAWIMLFSIVLFFYLSSLIFKLFLIIASFILPVPSPTKNDIAELKDEDLPPYTILVPMYNEGELILSFIEYFKTIDYPKDKLDVRILLEEDDAIAWSIIKDRQFERQFSFVKIPKVGPRTKPKALNVGIIDDESEILTIYDAEDRPETNQLKKIAWSFKNLPKDVVCIQAKLTFYNANENLLTKWFFAEYHSWFNHFLPALFSLSLPIPLGGTSNHFKTSALKEIGGWDPYNVTEDADLGIRISRLGYKISMVDTTSVRLSTTDSGTGKSIAVIDSPTYEEANTNLKNWMRQRIRWIKGYLQTSFVHLREPFSTMKDLSFNGFFSFFFFLLGTPIGHIINLFAWIVTILWLINRDIIPAGIPDILLFGGWLSFVAGNILFISIHFFPAVAARRWKIAIAALLTPIYWLLMSIATLFALKDLIIRPHHWNKTKHGLSKSFF